MTIREVTARGAQGSTELEEFECRMRKTYNPPVNEHGHLIEATHTPNAMASLKKGDEVLAHLGIRSPMARCWIHPLACHLTPVEILSLIKTKFIGAHHDDALFPLGDLYCRGIEGTDLIPVSIMTMTNGAGFAKETAGPYATMTDEQMYAQRFMEDNLVAYGGKIIMSLSLGLPSADIKFGAHGFLPDRMRNDGFHDVTRVLANLANIEELITHNTIDTHGSHKGVGSLVLQAARDHYAQGERAPRVYGAEVWGGLEHFLELGLIENRWIPKGGIKVIENAFRQYFSQVVNKGYHRGLPARLVHLITLSPDQSHAQDPDADGRILLLKMDEFVHGTMTQEEYVSSLYMRLAESKASAFRKKV